jgi:hypothetical protein
MANNYPTPVFRSTLVKTSQTFLLFLCAQLSWAHTSTPTPNTNPNIDSSSTPTPHPTPTLTPTKIPIALHEFTLNIDAEFHQFFTFDISGTQKLTQLDNNCWRFELKLNASVASQNSHAISCIKGHKLIPVEFIEKQSLGWDKTNLSGTFEQSNNTWLLKDDGKKKERQSEHISYDNLTQQLMVHLALEAGDKFININSLDGSKLKLVQYEVRNEERIRTPMGNLLTKKLIQRKGQRSGERNYMWVSKINNMWLPIRVKRYDGKKLKYQIDTVKIK